MKDGLTPMNNGELISQPTDIIPESDESVKVLRLSHRDRSPDFGRMLAAAVQLLSAADVIGKVQKGVEFVVQVPAEYQAALQSGALEMLHGAESGKTWATLVRKLANGKNEFVCNCPIAEQMRTQGNPVQGIAGTYQNLYMQQKLAELSEQVQLVYDTVLRIEQGQMDDRIGKLVSGKNDMMLALENDDLAARKREIELARSKISEAQAQIGQVLKSRVEAFQPIPESTWGRRFKEILSPTTSYMKKQDEEFTKLQEYFEFYLRATQLLAWTHTVVGERSRAEMVFKQAIAFLRTIDFSKVTTLDHIYPMGTMTDAFYHQPVPYFQTEQVVCLEEARPYDFVQITVSGEELKEAISNGSKAL